jgi:hypothetical protein
MALTYDDFKRGERLYYGRLSERFYVDGKEFYKLPSGEFFSRADLHFLSMVGLYSEVEIHRIQGRLVLVFLENHNYTVIESVEVIESQTLNQFDGFENGKLYNLKNGQVWQQINGPHAPNHHSAGNVRIVNNEKMAVDNWNFFPTVRLLNQR